MNSDFLLWTITYITPTGLHTFIECDTEEDTKHILRELNESGQDMLYVNIFPPKSNAFLSELV